MTHRLIIATFAAATIALAGCGDKRTNGATNGTGASADAVDPGAPLFAAAAYPPANTDTPGPDPVAVPMASVVVLRKLDLPSKVDGAILWVGVETDEATAAKLPTNATFRHPRDKKVYRRLKPGDFVKRDQVIAFLDDDHAFIEYKAAAAKAEAAKKSATAYEGTVAKLKEIVQQTREGVEKGIVPRQELLNSQATEARYQAELVDHQGSANVAAAEAERAKHQLDKHTLRATVDGEVQQVIKREGDGVKATEPILVLHDISELRALGNLPKEYLNTISPGDEVTIEVPRDVPPGATFGQHTTNKAIVAVAVGQAGGQPVIVSAGEDGLVYVWDRDLKVLGSVKVPGGVRSLAITRPAADRSLALIGATNGTASVIDLSQPSPKPTEFEGKHDGGVAAAAFSPDGRFCVTADERAIYMYDVGTGKRKYTFPAREHHSPVTSLSFTPQGRVVSVGREPSIRVWIVGQESAKVEHRIDSRSGDVAMPGVTDDGARLLLDADKTHLDVIHLEGLRKERPLVIAGESARFTTFTAWSPELTKGSDDRRIATTGAADGVVQLWKAPNAKTRGSEVARFITRSGAASTCACFSPQAENGFLVVGTRKGEVHLWALPAADEVANVTATVTHVENTIESSGRTVNVLVDFDNPKTGTNKYLLRPGNAVTLVIVRKAK